MNELDDFTEWLESKSPEVWNALTHWRDEWEDEQRSQRKIDENLWEEYLQEWGRFKDCPVCNYQIFYIQPEDFPPGASLFVPCLQGCGGLYITNTEGNINSQFIEKGEEEND